MSFKDTEEWGGIWGMDSNVHPIYVSKVRVIDEGSCNGCTRQHGPDARTEPDAYVWMISLYWLSFRLCSECMTTLRSEIKWKVG